VSTDPQELVKWFRHSSPYINAHRGKTFVMMLPGAGIETPNFANIIHDIALLNSLGVKLVLVHGARPQIDRRLAAANIASEFYDSLRVTDQDSLACVTQAVGETRFAIEAALSTGLPNSPMHGAHIQVVGGNFVTAKPWGVVEGVDLQHTGKVRRVDSQALKSALDANAIVVLSPLGYSPTGEIFNVSFADVATQVAAALKADKLIAFSSEDGFSDNQGQLKRQLSLQECEQQLAQLKADNDKSQSLQACFDVCQQGIPRAQMVSYVQDGALLQELFTREGSGTLVYRDNYEMVRQATIDDVGGIIELITPLEQQGALVRRSRELLETEIDRFTVVEMDGAVIACAALYPFNENMAELACVATDPDYQGGGRAGLILQAIEQRAKSLQLNQLFVLTTQTAHWFLEQGFVVADINSLPQEKQSLYNFQRNSKVFIKAL
jgi:amino-acid N-acetyltransferase